MIIKLVVRYLNLAQLSDHENIDRFLAYLINNGQVDDDVASVGLCHNLSTYNSLTYQLFRMYLAGDLEGYN